uniref:Uncharacterized protein n=1 Tax=Trichobilharzia regenti TaxID=157069 RepID=A0AA85K6D7_TRIRE|nr:unnamed protein product [Trichobilharzia regenti]
MLICTYYQLINYFSSSEAADRSQDYDATLILLGVSTFQRAITVKERQLIDMNNKKAVAEENVQTLEDRLEAQARETGKSITKFVSCLFNISTYYYEPEIYRNVSQTIREVQQSCGNYLYISQSRDIWRESLIHGSKCKH